MSPDDLPEISFDNDCILWSLPSAIRNWLEDSQAGTCLLAEDVKRCFGRYERFCGQAPRNLGIRGLPPGFDYSAALQAMFRDAPFELTSELDEQGLQVAALSRSSEPLAVSADEVTICSPFPPHLPRLGSCGAHFVGLNARELPWKLNGRGASDYTRESWRRLKCEVARRVGAP